MDQQQNQIPIFELYDIWYTPLLSRLWVQLLIALLVIVCVGAIAWLIYRAMKRRNNRSNAYEQAVGNVRALDPVIFHARHDSDAFYVHITYALKKYCVARFHFAAGMTDEEFTRALEQLPITDDVREATKQIMTGAQYSKFAQHDAALERMKEDVDRSYALINSLEHIYKQQEMSV